MDSQFLDVARREVALDGKVEDRVPKNFHPKWSLWLFGCGFISACVTADCKVQDHVVLRWPALTVYNSGISKQRCGTARFILIAYIASGHFIHTATKNPFLLRMITQAGWRCGCTGEPRIHSKSFWSLSLRNRSSRGLSRAYCILYTAVD